MKFGAIPIDEAEGAILAHRQSEGGRLLKKGRVLSSDDIEVLRNAGVKSVLAARLEPGDIGEDVAAGRIGAAARGENVSVSTAFTGRVNLHAGARGVVMIDREALDRINTTHEAVTIATVAPFEVVEAKQMVATIKIIPFAAPGKAVEDCADLAAAGDGLIRIAPFRRFDVGLIQTVLADTKASVLDKTAGVIGRRVEALDSRLKEEIRCSHDAGEITGAIEELRARGCGMVLILGASAITDRRDVVPEAIERAGGKIEHFGMPVDPGNLLLLGRFGDEAPVLGLPGCARSPKLNGFDWVLQRLLAELPLAGRDIMTMGAGGLLKEVPGRLLTRAAAVCKPEQIEAPVAPRVAAIILAAGRSRRMGKVNKLLAELDGKPMVVRVAEAVLASRAKPVIAVVGHQADKVRAALSGLDVTVVENPDYAAGLSTSLRRGLAAAPGEIDGVLVCLGDMPNVTPADIDRLIGALSGFVVETLLRRDGRHLR
jgi:molybdenum cofactor cytidylyltransferase